MKRRSGFLVSICSVLLIAIGSVSFLPRQATISGLKFKGEYIIPFHAEFSQTRIGGLSGIDYDVQKNVYYLLSDDRSDINPVRYYTAQIDLSDKGIDTVHFVDVHFLRQQNGNYYESAKRDAANSVDPEDIRFNPKNNQLVWASEGERIINNNTPILNNPIVQFAQLSGDYAGMISLPASLQMQASESGPRRNGTLEGLAFSEDFNTLFVSLEEPLYEDGPRADVKETDYWTRIYEFDMNTRQNKAQYAYRIEPVAHSPIPENEFHINGISEILSIGKNKLLVVERSYSTGHQGCTVKLFIADLSAASNIESVSLKQKSPTRPVQKETASEHGRPRHLH